MLKAKLIRTDRGGLSVLGIEEGGCNFRHKRPIDRRAFAEWLEEVWDWTVQVSEGRVMGRGNDQAKVLR